MHLKELLGIEEEIYLVEESYLAQRTIGSTLRYLKGARRFLEGGRTRLLRVKEGENTLGILIFNAADEEVPVDFWSVFTGALAAAPMKKEFENIAGSVVSSNIPERDIEVSSESWRNAVNEYYSFHACKSEPLSRVVLSGPSLMEVFSQRTVCAE